MPTLIDTSIPIHLERDEHIAQARGGDMLQVERAGYAFDGGSSGHESADGWSWGTPSPWR